MSSLKLIPPCSYQGGKQRLASQICDIIENKEGNDFIFYDLCCGSGAVGLEMVNRGKHVVMVDKSVFGTFYEMVGKGEFDLTILKEEIDKLPSIEQICTYLRELSNQPVDKERYVYQYLLLQAGAFGSKQIWIEGDKWCNNTFRSYWKPTPTSSRRSPVNPMMPMPDTLYSRVAKIVLSGSEWLTGLCTDIINVVDMIKNDNRRKVIYIDPPYLHTTGYGETFDIFEVINKLHGEHMYISESFEFDLLNCEHILLSVGRKKGNINGTVKQGVREVLNIIT